MFYLKSCPYCKKAFAFIDELKRSDPKYNAVKLTLIEEKEQPEIAAKYDYYYVPTFYVGGEKIFEGAPKITDIEKVLDTALDSAVIR